VNSDIALQMMRDLLWAALTVSAPVLGITMLVGLAVSFAQVITQVQEMSLTFIPKLVAASLALVFCGGWMLHKVMQFAVHLWSNIPALFS